MRRVGEYAEIDFVGRDHDDVGAFSGFDDPTRSSIPDGACAFDGPQFEARLRGNLNSLWPRAFSLFESFSGYRTDSHHRPGRSCLRTSDANAGIQKLADLCEAVSDPQLTFPATRSPMRLLSRPSEFPPARPNSVNDLNIFSEQVLLACASI